MSTKAIKDMTNALKTGDTSNEKKVRAVADQLNKQLAKNLSK